MLRHLTLLAVFVGATLLLSRGGAPAQADDGLTRGDCQASFETFLTAGLEVVLRAPHGFAAPVDGFGGRIAPYPIGEQTVYQGDWNQITGGWFTESGDYACSAIEAAKVDYVIRLDRSQEPLETTRTSLKRVPVFSDGNSFQTYAFVEGACLPPGSLSVGKHRLRTIATFPLYGSDLCDPDGATETFEFQVTFEVLPGARP
jgi:hypothetical protein